MEIDTVSWGGQGAYKHKSCCPPDKVRERCPLTNSHKIQGSRLVYKLLEIPVSCSKVKGKCQDGVPWSLFPESTSVGSSYVPDFKTTPEAKAPAQANRYLSQKDWGYFFLVHDLSSVVGVVVCQELSLQLLKSHKTQKHKLPWPPEPGNEGVTLGCCHKNWGYRFKHRATDVCRISL